MKHGMKVTKLRTVYYFRQSPRLANLFYSFAHQRVKTKAIFETNFYKFLMRDFFGKLIENNRKSKNLDLIDKTDTQ